MRDKDLILMLQEQIAEKDEQIEKLLFLLNMKIGHYHYPSFMEPFFLFNDKQNKVLRIDLNRVTSYLEFKGLEVKDGHFVIPKNGNKTIVSFEEVKSCIYGVLQKQALQFKDGQYEDIILDMFYKGFGLTNEYLKDKFKSR
ncbi:MAG: hypothetical protein IJN06_07110 [Bacteroidales bacterium]|nr:hypothetical protein [Bacteroidales bacterium]